MGKMLARILAVCAALQFAVAQDSNSLGDVLTNDGAYFTTNFGQPVFSENASLTVGPRGATHPLGSLTHDFAHGMHTPIEQPLYEYIARHPRLLYRWSRCLLHVRLLLRCMWHILPASPLREGANLASPIASAVHRISLVGVQLACATGPVLLEDYEVQEKLFSLNRERIPERVVHAKGAVAKGYFEVCTLATHCRPKACWLAYSAPSIDSSLVASGNGAY